MLFRNSRFEERYNRYWNQCVVPVDQKIQAQFQIQRGLSVRSTFFEVSILSVLGFIGEYVQSVSNIIMDLSRHGDFEDIDYVQEYLRNTKACALADLQVYRKKIGSNPQVVAKLDSYLAVLNALETTIEKTDELEVGSNLDYYN